MYYREHKGYVLEIEEYTGDSKNDVRYLGRCEELDFERRNRELSSLIVNFREFVDKKIENKKISEYEDCVARFLAIKEGVNSVDSQLGMYNYATSTWPEFVEVLLKVIKERTNDTF